MTEEGSIAHSLGMNKAVILNQHGNLTVGETIESALCWFIMLEKECENAMAADRAGAKLVEVSDEEARFTSLATGHERGGFFKGCTYMDVIESRQGHEYM